ncbi:MAG TPA: siroheme synthase CysG [Pseudolabrys sp.]|nr:siroheme synthase CysG [Pseudolabrys sp.]
MRFLPLFLDPATATVALMGNGAAASAKLRLLRAAGATVHWFSAEVEVAAELLQAAQPPGRVEIDLTDPLQADISRFAAIIAAFGDARDEAISQKARASNVLINVVDRPELSTFIMPATVDRGDVVVAIGTGGASPVLARRIRERIEALLPARVGELAALMGRHRCAFARARHPSRSLRKFWEEVIDGPIGAAVLAGRKREAEAALQKAIDSTRLPEKTSGTVHLVGAGPGDPDLLTLRALNALQNADIVFYDELVSSEILSRARRDAELVAVGKRKGAPGIGQDEINRRLFAAARAGQQVVRLKGGDPFVFGRGGEELDYLRAAGIAVFVIPGVTAALGCAAEAGLPLTFRNEATRLVFVTAATAEGAQAIDWSGLADPQATVVVYMGLSSAAAVRAGLIAAGRNPSTPAAVLARGTRPDAQSAFGTLDALPALAASVGDGPALLVIGEVAARADAVQSKTDEPTTRNLEFAA